MVHFLQRLYGVDAPHRANRFTSGRPKIETLPYLSNGLTDCHERLQDDADCMSRSKFKVAGENIHFSAESE